MAVLQYIGARYVPKLFDDGNGGMEWKEDTYYEPLTIVTYNNSSYISRTPVPASIGNPVDNGQYWSESGTYNAYVRELAGAIEKMSKRLNKRYIFIGDSYMVVENGALQETIREAMRLKEGDYFFSAQGGARFAAQEPTYLSLLKRIASSVTDPDTITDIVVLGGVNDVTSNDRTEINNAMISFDNYVRSTYPHAKVHLGFISKSTDPSNQEYWYDTVLSSYITCGFVGWGFIPGSPNWLPYNGISADGLHPNPYGCTCIAWGLTNYLRGADNNAVHREPLNAAVNLASGITSDAPFVLRLSGYNQTYRLSLPSTTLTFASPIAREVTLGSCQQNYLRDQFSDQFVSFPALCYHDGAWDTYNVGLKIGTSVKLFVTCPSGISITKIWMEPSPILIDPLTA